MIRTAPIKQTSEMIRTTMPGKPSTTDAWKTPPRTSAGIVKSFLENPPTVPVPNQVVVPSPFFVHSRRLGDPGAHEKPLILRYGQKVTVELEGAKLTTSDEDVFLALMQLAQFYESLSFKTSISELVRFIGSADSAETRQKVWRSLKRQNWATARILLKDNGDCFDYNVTFVVRYLTMKNGKELCVELDPFLARMFEKAGVTRLDTKFRRQLKGEISKRLYAFFSRSWKRKGIYSIGLRKLCRLIGLEIKGKQPWQFRQQIKLGLEELQRKGFIDRFIIEDKTIVRISFPDVKLKEITEESLEQMAAEEYTAELKKKRARYRKLEEGVPEGQCPHGYEWGGIYDPCSDFYAFALGQIDDKHQEACEHCGRWRACEKQLLIKLQEEGKLPVDITDSLEEMEITTAAQSLSSIVKTECTDEEIERALEELELSGNCPHGHRWAVDCDKTDECNDCDEESWKTCSSAQIEAEDWLR